MTRSPRPDPADSAKRTPMAGGSLIALGIVGGAIIGVMQGEAPMGALIGLGVGAAAALAIWLIDRSRTR